VRELHPRSAPALGLIRACTTPTAPFTEETNDSSAETSPAETTAAETARDTAAGTTQGDTPAETVPSAVLGFSPARGLHDAPLSVEITAPVSTWELRFTTDSRDPALGHLYTGPVSVETTTVLRAAALLDGEVVARQTHTYLFPDHLADQQAPADYPAVWWPWANGTGYTADYALDAEITESELYGPQIDGALRSLPVVSLALDPDDLFGAEGIYENSLEEGADWERPVSMEFFGAEQSLHVDAGLRLYGGASRYPYKAPKKSLRLAFRSEYGPAELEAPLFGDTDVASFDTLVLRARFNRSWIHWDPEQRSSSQYLRDAFVRASHADMDGVSTHGQPVHLLLNGLYWGLYRLHERPSAPFLADYLGGTSADWDALNSGDPIDGDGERWAEMFAAARADLSDPDAYAEIGSWLELTEFADYMLLNLLMGNSDWPSHNWYAGGRREGDAHFRFISWDAEHVLAEVDENHVSVSDAESPGELFRALRESPEFVVLFGDRVQRHCFEDGALTPAALLDRWAALTAGIEDAVVMESARWGDYRRDVHQYYEGPYELYTVEDHWRPEQERIRAEFLPQRTAVVIGQLRDAGLFPLLDAPTFSIHAGAITVEADAGEIYLTLDGSDPRQVGGAVSETAQRIESGAMVHAAGLLRARALSGADWSALTEADVTR